MKISDILKQPGRTFSLEIFPPKNEAGEIELYEEIKQLKLLNPAFVSVTYGAGGSSSKNTRKVVLHLKNDFGLEPMPHMTCVDQSSMELRNMLEDYRNNRIENILALRGDPPKGSLAFIPGKNGFCNAKDLIKLALSVGGFSIGVAVYPEGHITSPSLEMDMVYTKEKIETGADFAITQMFFDNMHFYSFLERSIKAGIRIPIIPGIMPIVDIKGMQKFSNQCGTELPSSVVKKYENTNSPAEVGIELATRQCEDLLQHGVKHLHFYTLNHSAVVSHIIQNLGLAKTTAAVS